MLALDDTPSLNLCLIDKSNNEKDGISQRTSAKEKHKTVEQNRRKRARTQFDNLKQISGADSNLTKWEVLELGIKLIKSAGTNVPRRSDASVHAETGMHETIKRVYTESYDRGWRSQLDKSSSFLVGSTILPQPHMNVAKTMQERSEDLISHFKDAANLKLSSACRSQLQVGDVGGMSCIYFTSSNVQELPPNSSTFYPAEGGANALLFGAHPEGCCLHYILQLQSCTLSEKALGPCLQWIVSDKFQTFCNPHLIETQSTISTRNECSNILQVFNKVIFNLEDSLGSSLSVPASLNDSFVGGGGWLGECSAYWSEEIKISFDSLEDDGGTVAQEH